MNILNTMKKKSVWLPLVIFLTPIIAYTAWVVDYNIKNPIEQPKTSVEKPKSKYEVGKPTAKEMLELVNMEREKHGAKPLTIDPNVQKSAQLKADDFSKRDYYSHIIKGTKYTLTQEMEKYINASCSYSSENINGDILNSKSAIDTWMGSKPHKKAILDKRYTLTGFGISQEKDGDYFTVQHFCIAK